MVPVVCPHCKKTFEDADLIDPDQLENIQTEGVGKDLIMEEMREILKGLVGEWDAGVKRHELLDSSPQSMTVTFGRVELQNMRRLVVEAAE